MNSTSDGAAWAPLDLQCPQMASSDVSNCGRRPQRLQGKAANTEKFTASASYNVCFVLRYIDPPEVHASMHGCGATPAHASA